MPTLVTKYPGDVFGTAHLIGIPESQKLWPWTRRKKGDDKTWAIYRVTADGTSKLLWMTCKEPEVASMMEIIEARIARGVERAHEK